MRRTLVGSVAVVVLLTVMATAGVCRAGEPEGGKMDPDAEFAKVYKAVKDPTQFLKDAMEELISSMVPSPYQKYAFWLWNQVNCLIPDIQGLDLRVKLRGICTPEREFDLVEMAYLLGRDMWRHYRKRGGKAWNEGKLPDRQLKGTGSPVRDLTEPVEFLGPDELEDWADRPADQVAESQGKLVQALAELPVVPKPASTHYLSGAGRVYRPWLDEANLLLLERTAFPSRPVPLNPKLVNAVGARRESLGVAGLQSREKAYYAYYMGKLRRVAAYRRTSADVAMTYVRQEDTHMVAAWMHDSVDTAGSLAVALPELSATAKLALLEFGFGLVMDAVANAVMPEEGGSSGSGSSGSSSGSEKGEGTKVEAGKVEHIEVPPHGVKHVFFYACASVMNPVSVAVEQEEYHGKPIDVMAKFVGDGAPAGSDYPGWEDYRRVASYLYENTDLPREQWRAKQASLCPQDYISGWTDWLGAKDESFDEYYCMEGAPAQTLWLYRGTEEVCGWWAVSLFNDTDKAQKVTVLYTAKKGRVDDGS